MEVDFQLLVENILNGNKVALRQLVLISSIMVRNWARKEKLELKWIAESGKLVDYRRLVENVINKYITEERSERKDNFCLELFKQFLIEELGNELRIYFSEFMKLLKNNQHQAWKIVFNDLEIRSAAWFYNRKNPYKEENHSLFCESMESVYSKFMKNEFIFNDSRAFKSYFFKTLENKCFESVKNPYLKKAISLDKIDFHDISDPEGERNIEQKENQKMLQKALGKLSHNERFILTEYFFGEKKLKEIASETGQSEENIRIRKHRALKKLFNHFKLMGYGS